MTVSFENCELALASVAQFVGVLSHSWKGHGQVLFLVRAHT